MYTEPCHVGHFGAFSKAMHINGPPQQQLLPLRSWGVGVVVVCVLTVRLFSETYALQIENYGWLQLPPVPVALFS